MVQSPNGLSTPQNASRRALFMFLRMQDTHVPFRLLQLCGVAFLCWTFRPGYWIPVWLAATAGLEIAGYLWSRSRLDAEHPGGISQTSILINDLIGHVILAFWIMPALLVAAAGEARGRLFALLLLAGIGMVVSWQHGRLRVSALINAALPGIAMISIAFFADPFDLVIAIAAVMFSANSFFLTLAAQRSDDAMFKAQAAQDRLVAELDVAREAAEHGRLEAERHAKARADFLAIMSHEIRTPLNGVIALSDDLARSDLAPRQQDQARAISDSGRMLLSIVNDILDQSRIEAGHMTLAEDAISLRTLLEDGLAIWRARAREDGIDLVIESDEAPPAFIGDAQRIRQILNNLIGNAFKFTPSGLIRLSASRQLKNGTPHLAFSVTDSGIGIAPDDLARIFERYERVESGPAQRLAGTGLGLSISRDFARLMGGDILVESAIGRGSTFRFLLPLVEVGDASVEAATNGRMPPPSRPSKTRQLRILVADDNEINHAVINAVLCGIAPDIDRAYDGDEALEKVNSGAGYDLVLMDVRMPRMDGLAAIRAIRSAARFTNLPIIALTANTDLEDEHAAYEAGADAWLPKPIDARKLLSLIHELADGQKPTPGLECASQ